MSNYSATVVRISNLRPHTNADRLICTNIFGNNVIVGKETQIGDLGLFFPLESQLGKEFAEANDLLRRKDENGKPAGGMFDDNRRVRAQKFRGEQSMGFWIPIESIQNLSKIVNIDTWPVEGDEIEKIGSLIISQKYVPRNSRMPGAGGRKEGRKPRESRILPDQFRFHFDTAQLGKNIHKLKPTDLVVITWKLHGTSAIAARVLVKRSLSWFEKLLTRFGVHIDPSVYDDIYASRRVVKNEFQETKDHYYGHDLWTEVGKEHFGGKLHTGETVYYEIVGYTKDGAYIQKDFDYGCSPQKNEEGEFYTIPSANPDDVLNLEATPAWRIKPQHKVFVYRITQTAVDGTVTELQWNQVKERCVELGVEHVPEIMYGEADLFAGAGEATGFDLEEWQKQYLEYLRQKFVYDQDSQFCTNKVPEEGICVRKEGLNIEVFKLKSFRFLEYETKSLDKGEVDIETEQSEPTAEDEYLVNV